MKNCRDSIDQSSIVSTLSPMTTVTSTGSVLTFELQTILHLAVQ